LSLLTALISDINHPYMPNLKANDEEAATVASQRNVPTESDALLDKGEQQTGFLPLLGLEGLGEWFAKLEEVFGYKLLVVLHVIQHLNKGFAMSFAGKGIPYIYKEYNVPATTMQIYGGVLGLPWAMKPIIGLVSDVFPINGYNKAPYIFIISAMAAVASFVVGTSTESTMSVEFFVTCCFIRMFFYSTIDLLSEAKYAEAMQRNFSHGPAIMTYVWFGLVLAGLFATAMSGYAIEYLGPRTLFLVAAIPGGMVLFPVAMNYLEEKQLSNEEIAEARSRYWCQKEACFLCILMLVGSLFIICYTLRSTDPLGNAVVSVTVAGTMLIASSVCLNPTIAKANAFALIQTSLHFHTGAASFYFYTDTPEQYPEGPHFSKFFYNSSLGVVGSLVTLMGIYTYQRYLTSWKYRSITLCTCFAVSILSIFDCVMYARINVKYGVPDHALVLGTAASEGLIETWRWMPQVLLMSYLCPKGMEATMYALLAGCHNLGNTVASNCGALLLNYLEVTPRGEENESAQFANLWKASAISVILPLFASVVLVQLLPDARQNERIVHETNGDATSGSLWRRWTEHRDAQ